MPFVCPSARSCCRAWANHSRQTSLSVLSNASPPPFFETLPFSETLRGPRPENSDPPIVTLAAPLGPVGLPGAGLGQPAADHVADRKVGYVPPRRIRPEALVDDHRRDQYAQHRQNVDDQLRCLVGRLGLGALLPLGPVDLRCPGVVGCGSGGHATPFSLAAHLRSISLAYGQYSHETKNQYSRPSTATKVTSASEVVGTRRRAWKTAKAQRERRSFWRQRTSPG